MRLKNPDKFVERLEKVYNESDDLQWDISTYEWIDIIKLCMGEIVDVNFRVRDFVEEIGDDA